MRSFVASASVPALLVLVGCSTPDSSSPAPQVIEPGQVQQALTTVRHSTFSGGGAAFSQWGQFGGTSLRAFQTPTGAWLDFSVSSVDPTSEVCVDDPPPPPPPPLPGDPGAPPPPPPPPMSYCYYTRTTQTVGFGEIPAASFSVRNGNASLAASLADGPGFTLMTCTFDNSTWQSLCAPASPSSVAVSWKADGNMSSFSTGVNEKRYGKFMFRSNGTYRSASANATGTLLGGPVAGWGEISKTTGVNVQIDVYQAPPGSK